MSFRGEMKDFLDASRAMSGTRLQNAQRRKIDWDIEPNPYAQGETPSSIGTGGGGGDIGTTTAPDDGKKSASGDRKYNDAKLGNRGGGSFVQQVYDYYRSKGLPHAAAAGMAGNFGQESGGDPRVLGGHRTGDAGKSKFVAQWNGSRLTNLFKFAGTQQPTLQQQLDFALEEMNPNSPYADKQAAAAYDQLLGAKTVEDATAIFRSNFERPSADDLGKRIAWAKQATDGGNYGASAVASGPAAAAPDKTAASSDAGAIPDEGDTQTADAGSADITVPAAPEAAPVETPQVDANF
ncbi:MAG TPA: phage tail tip lysozyme, partial [Mycobacterium sp.]|nr:phage tail tip lysozyme [Mycobacterium sp.]